MWHRNKQASKSEEHPEVVLRSPEGKPWVIFPSTVVEPIRRFISHIRCKTAIPQRLSCVAALRQEGVSYISCAIATTMAYDLETSVCIVCLNWYWPSDLYTKLPASGGLSAVLAGEASLKDAIVRTGKSNFGILPAGELPIVERPHLARSSILEETILELNIHYDHLILDVPAVLATNDAIPLASLGTTSCLIIHQGVTSIEESKSALNDLGHLPCLGVVMNRYRVATPEFIHKFLNPYSSPLSS